MKQIIWTTTNFIAPVMVIFLLFLAFFLYPRMYRSTGDGTGCQAGKIPSRYEEATLFPIGVDWSSEDFTQNTQYVKIRQDVPITTDLTAFCPELYTPNSSNTCVHFSPMRVAEFPNDIVLYPRAAAEHDFINTLTQKPGDFFPIKEKVLFLLHMESIYQPKILTVRPSISSVGANGVSLYYEKILLADAYQEKSRYQQVMAGLAGYRYEDVFKCDAGGPLPKLTDTQIEKIITTPGFNDPVDPVRIPELDAFLNNKSDPGINNVYIPPQSQSPNNEQLQLEWFVFDQSQGAWNSHCKPAVYLYPPQKMQVNVKVFPAGVLTYTDPLYDSKRGWTVDAYPDGTITTTYHLQPTNYPYLYFESKVRDQVIKKPTKGWVVQSSVDSSQSSEWFGPMEEKFSVILPQLGLNAIQTTDFIEYWKKALPYSPYYFIGIIDQENVDQIERLEITPKPDSINRVRIYFERLDSPKVVKAPELSAIRHQSSAESGQPKADGRFTVVEWGGMVKNDPNHPFTCSQ
jgi:hypothetical protein